MTINHNLPQRAGNEIKKQTLSLHHFEGCVSKDVKWHILRKLLTLLPDFYSIFLSLITLIVYCFIGSLTHFESGIEESQA